MKIKSLLIDSQ